MITPTEIVRIYDSLQDAESKDVFNMRLGYALGEKDLFDFYDLVSDKKCCLYKSFYQWLEKNSERDNLVIFGAGRIGRYTVDIIKNNDIDILACIDNNINGGRYRGVDIISFDKIASIAEKCKVVIASGTYRFQMLEQLLRNGFEMSQIWFPPFEFLRGYVGLQYFDYFTARGGEVFVDGGAYNGMTTVDFFKWAGNEKSMSYLFEANPKNEQMIKKILKDNYIEDYKLVLKGLYKKDTTLRFQTMNGAGARFSEEGESVEVSSIDNALLSEGRKVTFIKMDIEGAEASAIEGAVKLIERDSPRLALSVYHKPNDFLDIPNQLLRIHSDYRFAYRQYCTMGEETVLYAWRE